MHINPMHSPDLYIPDADVGVELLFTDDYFADVEDASVRDSSESAFRYVLRGQTNPLTDESVNISAFVENGILLDPNIVESRNTNLNVESPARSITSTQRRLFFLALVTKLFSILFNTELFLIAAAALLFGSSEIFMVGFLIICLNVLEHIGIRKAIKARTPRMADYLRVRHSRQGTALYTPALDNDTARDIIHGREDSPSDRLTAPNWFQLHRPVFAYSPSWLNLFVQCAVTPLYHLLKAMLYLNIACELTETLFSTSEHILIPLDMMGYSYFNGTALNSTSNSSLAAAIPGRRSFIDIPFGLFDLLSFFFVLGGIFFCKAFTVLSPTYGRIILRFVGSVCCATSLGIMLLYNKRWGATAWHLIEQVREYKISEMSSQLKISSLTHISALLFCFLYKRGAYQYVRACIQQLRGHDVYMAEPGSVPEIYEMQEARSADSADCNPFKSTYYSDGTVSRPLQDESAMSGASEDILDRGWSSAGVMRIQLMMYRLIRFVKQHGDSMLCVLFQLSNLILGCILGQTVSLPPTAWRFVSWPGFIAQGLLAFACIQQADAYLDVIFFNRMKSFCCAMWYLTIGLIFIPSYMFTIHMTSLAANSISLKIWEMLLGIFFIPVLIACAAHSALNVSTPVKHMIMFTLGTFYFLLETMYGNLYLFHLLNRNLN